jgi:hypothetical protein
MLGTFLCSCGRNKVLMLLNFGTMLAGRADPRGSGSLVITVLPRVCAASEPGGSLLRCDHGSSHLCKRDFAECIDHSSIRRSSDCCSDRPARDGILLWLPPITLSRLQRIDVAHDLY